MKFSNIYTEYFFGKSKQGKEVVVCKLKAALCYSYENEAVYRAENQVVCGTEQNIFGNYEDFEFVGKAVLAEGDKYDKELGCKIAESKAKAAMFRKLSELNLKVADILDKAKDEVNASYTKAIKCLVKEVEHYDTLVKTVGTEESK